MSQGGESNADDVNDVKKGQRKAGPPVEEERHVSRFRKERGRFVTGQIKDLVACSRAEEGRCEWPLPPSGAPAGLPAGQKQRGLHRGNTKLTCVVLLRAAAPPGQYHGQGSVLVPSLVPSPAALHQWPSGLRWAQGC